MKELIYITHFNGKSKKDNSAFCSVTLIDLLNVNKFTNSVEPKVHNFFLKKGVNAPLLDTVKCGAVLACEFEYSGLGDLPILANITGVVKQSPYYPQAK